jgi:7-cyano-7-deazaguanine tRNA-ribosyltransferase
MPFSFEVRETDLLGRIGTIKVGSRVLETPYLFPVIHPVRQLIPPSELKAMGFGGLMTNSYIIHSRRKEEALRHGIHRLLDFDGVLMTDSGGYQVLEYGELELGYEQVAAFQAEMGSDLAVTLDRPTGYPQTRATAHDTVEYSLRNAKATLKEFGGSQTTWVGPIQGGLYEDLVRRSAASMVKAGFGFLALGSPVQVMQSYMFADLVRMVMAAKRAIPYSVPLHLFGAGHPLTMSLAVALGCDTFDSASYIIFARSGRYMNRGGVLTLQSMKYLPCSCPVCTKTSVRGLLELDHSERTRLLSTHNLFVLREELEACKEAISEGRLWDLVEERSMAHPRLREAFMELSKYSEDLVAGTPPLKERGLFVRSTLDLRRPELLAAASRLSRSMVRSSDRALLAQRDRVRPTGAQKGGPGSDAYGTHPVLGLYPVELEFVYPFSQTVLNLVGPPPSPDESKRKLKAMGYKTVTVSERGGDGRLLVRSRRSRRGASPSPRSSSARPR